MDAKDVLRLLVMAVWTMMCVLAAVQGFSGLLPPFYAGLGWTILCAFNIGLTIAYWKINKLLKDFVEAFENAKLDIEKMDKEKDDGGR